MTAARRRNEWIADRLRQLGLNQRQLAQHMGLEPPRVSDILRGERRVQLDELAALSAFLQMDPARIAARLTAARAGDATAGDDTGDSSGPGRSGGTRSGRRTTASTISVSTIGTSPPGASPFGLSTGAPPGTTASTRSTADRTAIDRRAPQDRALEAMLGLPAMRGRERDLPIYGAAQGGDGVMLLDSDPIEYGERPANLLGVVGAYGVYVVNDSMAPAYEPGDKLHVHPGRPLRPGRDAIFVSEQPDGTRHATVKRLVKITDKAWKVEQFNPPRVFDLPRKTWQRAFRIVGSERAD